MKILHFIILAEAYAKEAMIVYDSKTDISKGSKQAFWKEVVSEFKKSLVGYGNRAKVINNGRYSPVDNFMNHFC